MASWINNGEHVQTIITTKLRSGGPRIYANRVQEAQRLAIAAYKLAFNQAMLKGQIDHHLVQKSAFREYYEKVDVDQVFQLAKKVVRRKTKTG